MAGLRSAPAGLRGSRPRRQSAPGHLLLLLAACGAAAWASTSLGWYSRSYIAPPVGARDPASDAAADLDVARSGALRRREAAGLAGLAAVVASSSGASAEVEYAAPADVSTYTDASGSATTGRLERLVLVMLFEDVDREVTFWTKAMLMTVQSDSIKDGIRTVVVAYDKETGGPGSAFAVEITADQSVKFRKRPRSLNYEVMQPFVPAVNFVQISLGEETTAVFKRVQANYGNSVFGDTTYLDLESPCGQGIRIASRPKNSPPSVDIVGLNVEVPAFDGVQAFYKQAFGYKEVELPSEFPLQKFSKPLSSGDFGGPLLLLSPVPDGRLKDKLLDEVVGLRMVTKDSSSDLAPALGKLADSIAEAERRKEEERQRLLKVKEPTNEEKRKIRRTLKGAPGTIAQPSAKLADGVVLVNDGVGNALFVEGGAEFQQRLSA